MVGLRGIISYTAQLLEYRSSQNATSTADTPFLSVLLVLITVSPPYLVCVKLLRYSSSARYWASVLLMWWVVNFESIDMLVAALTLFILHVEPEVKRLFGDPQPVVGLAG